MSDSVQTGPSLTPAQELLNDLWDEHVRDEFATRDTEATLARAAFRAHERRAATRN